MPHSHDDPRYPVRKTDAEWRAELDPNQYEVARHAATERAFSGKYWDHTDAGKYLCVGCGTPLFESTTKFDAGCGWPSYWEPINSEVVERVRDGSHGMVRVEVRCNKCGSHLGHVFEDGPEPTGERFLHQFGRDRFQTRQRMTADDIHALLQTTLAPTALSVEDDSHLHAGHAGAREGRHFTVRLTSERFTGLSRVARHRLVYDSFGFLASSGVHALAIVAKAPGEP